MSARTRYELGAVDESALSDRCGTAEYTLWSRAHPGPHTVNTSSMPVATPTMASAGRASHGRRRFIRAAVLLAVLPPDGAACGVGRTTVGVGTATTAFTRCSSRVDPDGTPAARSSAERNSSAV